MRWVSGVAVLASVLGATAVSARGKANSWAIVGKTGASAQQALLATVDKVVVIDKTENNPVSISGHPAWSTEYSLATNTYVPLEIKTNTFCDGGNQLGNGSWAVIGGNKAVTTGGRADKDLHIPIATKNSGAYDDLDGGKTTRILTCTDAECVWTEDLEGMPVERWYPTVETLEDGSVIILGGETDGGFVNSVNQHQSVPTYEFWPSRGSPIKSVFLQETQPANLYPLTWLLPNGLLFMQADWQTTLFNYTSGKEHRLPNITHAQKTYPASGSIAMLPLTPANNYTPTLLFCGGMDPRRDDWNTKKWAIARSSTSSSCVSIKPMDKKPKWIDEDDLPENRGMGNFIILPDERLFLSNGVAKGSAGYGWDSWAINQSYAQDPVLRPAYYDPNKPAGHRFSTDLAPSTIGRLYHSTSTLLPDGSIWVAGSNPNADVITEENNSTYVYKTEYRAEIYYPDYFDAARPVPTGIPKTITYGGEHFNLFLPASSLNGTRLSTIKVALIRTGFSTHAMNMGMRYLQLNHTFTGHSDGSATLHVSQLPPNPAVLVPGPALFFVTVNGIPSVAPFVMVGSGKIETQKTHHASVLPPSTHHFATNSSITSNARSSSGTDVDAVLTGSATVVGPTKRAAMAVLGSLTISLLALV